MKEIELKRFNKLQAERRIHNMELCFQTELCLETVRRFKAGKKVSDATQEKLVKALSKLASKL